MEITKKDIVFIDSNIFIYTLEHQGALGTSSREILRKIKKVQPTVYTSVLSVQEILVGVFKEGLEERIPEYLQFIAGEGLISILSITQDIAIQAASIRAEYTITTPDAIQLSAALHVGATIFVTADKTIFRKINTPKILLIGET